MDMKNLAAALIKAQAEMTPAYKDAQNPHLRNKYATLASVQESCVPALNANGIAVMQSVGTEWHDSAVLVKVGCTFYHAASGESLLNEIALMPSKPDPQGIGSAITYGRRYLLMAMAGIAPEDDDGNEASTSTQTKKPVQATTTQRSAPTPANGHSNATQTPAGDTVKSAAFRKFMAEGTTLFNGEWENARHWVIDIYTRKNTPDNVRTSANDLTDAELNTLAGSMKTSAKWFKTEWDKQAATVAA